MSTGFEPHMPLAFKNIMLPDPNDVSMLVYNLPDVATLPRLEPASTDHQRRSRNVPKHSADEARSSVPTIRIIRDQDSERTS